MPKNPLYGDTEFTGCHPKTSLVSLGLVTAADHRFYAEFTDYDKNQVNSWIGKNVIQNLKLLEMCPGTSITEETGTGTTVTYCKGDRGYIKGHTLNWLDEHHIAGSPYKWHLDLYTYDMFLLTDLLCTYKDGYPVMPEMLNDIYPADLSHAIAMFGLDPDTRRCGSLIPEIELYELYESDDKGKTLEQMEHNALFGARVCKKGFNRVRTLDIIIPMIRTKD